MAIDYLSALKEYSAGGGKSIDDFLKQHTTAPVAGAGNVLPATPAAQPAGVAARLAAADSRDRLAGLGAPVGTNVLTNPALRPVTAQSDALQAKIDARSNVVVQPAGAQAAGSVGFAPTPRRIAPTFDAVVPVSAASSADTGGTEKPWWQQSSFDKGFQSFVNDNSQAAGRDERANSFVRLNRNTYIPATQNYNRSSSL